MTEEDLTIGLPGQNMYYNIKNHSYLWEFEEIAKKYPYLIPCIWYEKT